MRPQDHHHFIPMKFTGPHISNPNCPVLPDPLPCVLKGSENQFLISFSTVSRIIIHHFLPYLCQRTYWEVIDKNLLLNELEKKSMKANMQTELLIQRLHKQKNNHKLMAEEPQCTVSTMAVMESPNLQHPSFLLFLSLQRKIFFPLS